MGKVLILFFLISSPLWAGLPPRVELSDFKFCYQSFNNCGPASLSIFLSHYGFQVSQDILKSELRTDDKDPSVTFFELEASLRSRGFFTALRFGGDLSLIKQLLAQGNPVLLRFWLKRTEKDQLGHTVLAIGYDDIKEHLILEDPLNGSRFPWAYGDLEASWGPYNYAFLTGAPAGTPEASSLKEILGPLGDLKASARVAEQRARGQLAAQYNGFPQAFQWFNLGTSLWCQGQYKEAAEVYLKSRSMGWPWRILWYQSYPLECWYRSGMTAAVKEACEKALRDYPELPEVKAWLDAVTPGNVNVYISDSHTGSFYFFAKEPWIVPRTLVNIDAHGDLWPTPGQETLPWSLPTHVQSVLSQWRQEGRVQCYSWILPLMEGPVESMTWVGGGPSADQAEGGYKDFRAIQSQGQGVWEQYIPLYKKVNYRTLDSFLNNPNEAPWVSVDLDAFFKRPRKEALDLTGQTFQALGRFSGLKTLTVAISRDYLSSDSEAEQLLETALSEILKWPRVKVTMDGTFHESENSQWARDLLVKWGKVPVFNFEKLSPKLNALIKDSRVTFLRDR